MSVNYTGFRRRLPVPVLDGRQRTPEERAAANRMAAQRRRDAQHAAEERAHLRPTLDIDTISNHDRLYILMRQMGAEPEKARGPDSVRLTDLASSDLARIARKLSRVVRDNSYRSPPPVRVPIPKRSGGHRTISIASIGDNVTARSIALSLEPFAESELSPRCHGFRPGRSHLDMLAAISQAGENAEEIYLVNDDIRQAYDRILHVDVISMLRGAIPDILQRPPNSFEVQHLDRLGTESYAAKVRRTCDLIMQLITAGNVTVAAESLHERVGINQGSSLSPMVMNLLLHKVLDAPLMAQRPNIEYHRYADNIAVACQREDEALEIRDEMIQLLGTAGLEFKGEGGGIFALSRQPTALLGFNVDLHERKVRFRLKESASALIESHWMEMSRTFVPPITSATHRQGVKGLVASWGPAYAHEDVPTTCETVVDTVRRIDRNCTINANDVHQVWQNAWRNWETLRNRTT